jgi:hypothetical protein
MTGTLDHAVWPGQLAFVNVRGRGRTVVRITKRNPKNYKAQLEDGTFVNGPHSAFTAAPAGTEFNLETATPTAMPKFYENGTVVRFNADSPYFKDTGRALYVVVAVNREGGHRLFKLGGSSRYWRGVQSSAFTVVPVDEINS